MEISPRTACEDPGEERRAAACIRACAGIPTELLERAIILRLIAACVHASEPRIREILEELVVARLREREMRSRTKLASGPLTRPGGG